MDNLTRIKKDMGTEFIRLLMANSTKENGMMEPKMVMGFTPLKVDNIMTAIGKTA